MQLSMTADGQVPVATQTLLPTPAATTAPAAPSVTPPPPSRDEESPSKSMTERFDSVVSHPLVTQFKSRPAR